MRGKRFSENQALNLLPISASLTVRSTASLSQWGKGCSSQMMYQELHVYYCVEVPQPMRHSRALLAHLGSEKEREDDLPRSHSGPPIHVVSVKLVHIGLAPRGRICGTTSSVFSSIKSPDSRVTVGQHGRDASSAHSRVTGEL